MSAPDGRRLVVTLDTEADKDARWHVSDPVRFESVTRGIPEILTPLFEEFGVTPTYLLSAEVIEDPECVAALKALPRGELGTHLHGDFVAPERLLDRSNMAGAPADAVQADYPPELERAKLESLTQSFTDAFGHRPTSFRAGRFGLGSRTLESLAELGYSVDSSVTPGLVWRYPGGDVDFREWLREPRRVHTDAGPIVELPVGVLAGGRPASMAARLPTPLARGTRALLGDRARDLWLRPSWESGERMARYVDGTCDELLVLMFHSMEVIPGASPYAATEADAEKLVARLRGVLEHCDRLGIGSCGLTEAAALV